MNTRISRPLWVTITAAGLAAVLVSSVAVGAASFYRQYEGGEADIDEALGRAVVAVQADLDAQKRAATGLAQAIAGEPDMARLLAAGAREEIIARFHRNFEAVKAGSDLQLISFMNRAGRSVARVHAPTVFGDDVSGRRPMVMTAMQTGKPSLGIEPGREALSLFASVPV